MKNNKFTLIIDAKYTLNLTVNNYAKIIGNHGLVAAVENMLFDIQQNKAYGMASNASGYMIQIHITK